MRNIKLSKIIPNTLKVIGDKISIDGLNLCNRKSNYSSVLSYVESTKYIEDLKNNQSIKVILLRNSDYDFYYKELGDKIVYVITDHPEQLFYEIHDKLYYEMNFYDKFGFDSKIGVNASFGQNVVIEKGVIIGDNVKIGHNSVIKKGTVIENNVHIGCNSTIGSEGFQIVNNNLKRQNIVHVGGTKIRENTYIGDNCTVCNSLFEGYTNIGRGVKVDNLVHIAHNSTIGNNAVLTAGVILCGSTTILDNAWIGTNTTILNNVTIGVGAKIGIGSVVTRSIPDGQTAYGVPAKVHNKL